jgi:hypothetical protein
MTPTGEYYGTDDNLLTRSQVFFEERSKGNYVPRSLVTDFGSAVCDELRSGTLGKVLPGENFICSHAGSRGIFASHYYPECKEIVSLIMEQLRKRLDACDRPQGFLVIHSQSGGAGSGLTTALCNALSE